MRAWDVLSWARMVRGRSAPAGLRSPQRHLPEAAASRDQHIRERRRRGRWDGGKDYSCRRRTGQRGRPYCTYVPAAPVCAEAYHAGRTGPGPHGVGPGPDPTWRGPGRTPHGGGPGRTNTFPSGPAEPRLADQHGGGPAHRSFDSRVRTEEWSCTTPLVGRHSRQRPSFEW
jgi:hypothetical protein